MRGGPSSRKWQKKLPGRIETTPAVTQDEHYTTYNYTNYTNENERREGGGGANGRGGWAIQNTGEANLC